MVKFLLAAVMILSVSPYAISSPIVPQFYKVRVFLSDERLMEGYSWGVSWIGGASLQERKVKRVVLRVEDRTVIATFTFFGDNKPVIVKESVRDLKGRPRTLTIGSEFEVFHKGEDFYWMKGSLEYPLYQVLQVDTIRVLGQGYAVSDPRKYLNLKEPFIPVEDCGLGCEVRMFSRDAGVTKEILQKLWDQYFACDKRSVVDQRERLKVQDQYQIEWLTDPFCHD
jgi:hypothetical protein